MFLAGQSTAYILSSYQFLQGKTLQLDLSLPGFTGIGNMALLASCVLLTDELRVPVSTCDDVSMREEGLESVAPSATSWNTTDTEEGP